MASILLVVAKKAETNGLREELTALGHAVSVAPGSFYALTLLERNRPDVLIAWPDPGDMTAAELCAIVREDPAMAGVRLMIARPDARVVDAPADVPVVTPALSGGLARALARAIEPVPDPPATAPGGDAKPFGEKEGFRGPLETIRIENLVQMLAHSRRSGCLRIRLSSGESCAFFHDGRLVHALFGELSGEPAFHETILAATEDPKATFSFDRYDHHRFVEVPETITSRVDMILLEAAARLNSRQRQRKKEG